MTPIDMVSITSVSLVIVSHCVVLFNLRRTSPNAKTSPFIAQMYAAGLAVGVFTFLIPLIRRTTYAHVIACRLLVSLLTACHAIYMSHMFFANIELYVSVRKLSKNPHFTKGVTIGLSVSANVFFVVFIPAQMGFIRSDLPGVKSLCFGSIYAGPYQVAVYATFIILLVSMIVVHLLAIAQVKGRTTHAPRNRLHPTATNQTAAISNGTAFKQRLKNLKVMRALLAVYAVCWVIAFGTMVFSAICQPCKREPINTYMTTSPRVFFTVPYLVNATIFLVKIGIARRVIAKVGGCANWKRSSRVEDSSATSNGTTVTENGDPEGGSRM